MIKEKFKISLKEFSKFEEFVDFVNIQGKRVFVTVTVMLKYVRNLMLYLN